MGVRADFQPETFPEVGVCVHHMEMYPSNPDILYQQNHCGVYRTENAGDDWIDISDGLPSRFGFPSRCCHTPVTPSMCVRPSQTSTD